MPPIGVIIGLRSEASCLDIFGAASPLVRCSGARSVNAYEHARALIDLGCRGLVSFGTAGGLDARLGRGDVVLATAVSSPNGRTFLADESWRRAVAEAVAPEFLPTLDLILGTDAVVATPAAKRRIHDDSGAVAVDMESHAVAEVAVGAAVPFVVIRVVADDYRTALPAWTLDAVRSDGSISVLPAVAAMAMKPWTIGDVLRLGSDGARARESLRGLARLVGPSFGFPFG